jgi:hypothetical protein
MFVRMQLFAIVAIATMMAANSAAVFAQNPPHGAHQPGAGKKPQGDRFSGKGTIDSIKSDELSITTADGQSLTLKLPKSGSKVHVIGRVTPDELHRGKNVQFSAMLDKKTRRLKEPVKKLKIFTPSKDQPVGVIPDTAAKSDSGDDNIDLSTNWKPYIIAGSIQTIAAAQLTLNVPGLSPYFKVGLADGFQVEIDVSDLRLVKAGDTISVSKAIKKEDCVVHVMEATIHLARPKKAASE